MRYLLNSNLASRSSPIFTRNTHLQVFLDDYLCAIKKRMLHQGRMYVFDRHVCFHGNTFGHHETNTIPFSVREGGWGGGEMLWGLGVG